MATAVSARPVAPPPLKSKRPQPPAVQTSLNGVKSSQSSPSPSGSAKRPPAGFKNLPPTAAPNSAGILPNGTSSRLSNRRRDSQKAGDALTRQPKMGKNGVLESIHTGSKVVKRAPEPYVRTTSYVLKKYRKHPASLVLHLHPTHFRFDQQDGSFSYNSPMKVLLEHIKSQTVPHDMLEDLKAAGVRFYESCLIIQIQDHRSISASSQTTLNAVGGDQNIPFSTHNYNEHLTPSAFVPYPHKKLSEGINNSSNNVGSTTITGTAVKPDSEKENQQPSEVSRDKVAQTSPQRPKTFTTVLFPTPMSLQEEVIAFANTPDTRPNNRRQSTISGRTPSSATMPHPPTPLSAVPQTPTSAGPAVKRQKMMFSGKDIQLLEEKLIAASAPPLFLEPTKDMHEVQVLLQALQDPLCQESHPVPKTRKRTVAELAADEALAAEEQRFMLIMDERLVPSATGGGAGKTMGADGEAGAASFEPRFERLKALEEIKLALKEKAQREAETKAHKSLLREQQMIHEQKIREARRQGQVHQLHQNQHMTGPQSQQAQQQHQVQQHPHQQLQQSQLSVPQHHHLSGTNQHVAPQTSTAMHAHQAGVSQAHHSSPVVRNMTPHNNSSPIVGNAMMSHGGQSMGLTGRTPSQGAGSPPRPGSALQHAHPPSAASMVQQRSQQPPSRHGTPQVPQSTPRLQQGTPVIGHVTPTPRLSHASPTNSAMAATPITGHAMMPTQQMNGQQLTPQQQQHIFMQRQMLAQQQLHGSPPNPQQTNLQQVAALQAHQQAQQQAQQLQAHQQAQARASQEAYRALLQSSMHQQMANAVNNGAAHPAPNNMHAAQLAQQQQQNQNRLAQQNQLQQNPNGAMVQNYWQRALQTIFRQIIGNLSTQARAEYGQHIPDAVKARLHEAAYERARTVVTERKTQHLRQQQQQQQQQAVMMEQTGGGGNGGMMGGGMGMNGIGNMNGMSMNGMGGL